ncbi:hypothetical protein BC939DRAFT_502902 [Gamsiella multidivaricata]|uniref:uncharacterized protein n=1 Tax=Gamsiella multidivaricata TaxID=101098 RepID=UPI00221F2051|nr:uncharacterized protein BC939DRAFT_502902 [Gamsiella multidivaricata]KAI7824095.1 hypothetical protein BC939DRAFT_502902 [Gamsiella multidivaricata]
MTPLITLLAPNPNLHKSFHGLDYNPAKTLMPSRPWTPSAVLHQGFKASSSSTVLVITLLAVFSTYTFQVEAHS